MLCVTRKRGELVVVTDQDLVEIVVIKVIGSNGPVKLGFEANPNIKIFRSELLEDIKGDSDGNISGEDEPPLPRRSNGREGVLHRRKLAG